MASYNVEAFCVKCKQIVPFSVDGAADNVKAYFAAANTAKHESGAAFRENKPVSLTAVGRIVCTDGTTGHFFSVQSSKVDGKNIAV